MEQDIFTHLPPEIITNILLRLPLRTVAISKCVCKPWLHLLNTADFINSHLSKSAPALAVWTSQWESNRCAVFEFEDEVDHDRRYNPLTNFNFPRGALMESSIDATAANGLLLLYSQPETIYICNPINRHYIELCCFEEFIPQYPPYNFRDTIGLTYTYGLGVSKISGKIKVVRIIPKSDCRVYTLGTGKWRRVEASSTFDYGFCNESFSVCNFGEFAHGNLHWTVSDSNDTRLICCFDLETECFSFFSAPPGYGDLSVLKDCLCFCYITWEHEIEHRIVIWLMKEYGVEKSWSKEYVIGVNPEFLSGLFLFVYPIKVFKNGDILMLWNAKVFLYYCNQTKTSREIGIFDARDRINSMLLTPTFFSLKNFRKENVISF